VAASTAFARGIPLISISRAVAWKNASTFTNAYMREIVPVAGDVFAAAVLGSSTR
jgi:hypothetical protein